MSPSWARLVTIWDTVLTVESIMARLVTIWDLVLTVESIMGQTCHYGILC